MPDDDAPINRRAFFRQGLRQMFKPLARAAEPFESVIRQIGAMDDELAAANAHQQSRPPAVPKAPPNPFAPVLRPPGALPEKAFRDTCSRCGDCVRVCPAQCIQIEASGLRGNGVPFIDVDAAACVLCDGLMCMNTCPTGALVPVPMADIDMGTALWHADRCLRTVEGQPCTVCIDVCPIGEVAIRLAGNAVEVIADGCTGCGLCQNRCPTTPKSIVVRPTSADTAPSAAPRPRPR
jgi:MauM/NapG family ferredoxin protein